VGDVPKLWDETIEAHRHTVREAILAATWSLVTEHGLLSVTMSRIAEEAGVGRATLYKYFPDVESILAAWHERHSSGHLEHLAALAGGTGDVGERLRAVLEAYALIAYRRGGHATELAAVLHRGEQAVRAQRRLVTLLRDLVAEAVAQGQVREDVGARELALYCVHALSAAGDLRSQAAVDRLVDVTLDGLRR
jgi:AcrR family transcriptional regulator